MYYIMHWRDKMGVITSLQPFGQKKEKKKQIFSYIITFNFMFSYNKHVCEHQFRDSND